MSRAIEKRLKNKKLFQELKNAYLGSCEAVFLGSVLVGLIQAFLLVSLMALFSLPYKLLAFVFTFFLSFVPLVGTAPVILTLAAYEAFSVDWLSGLVFLGVTGLTVGLSDNLIRIYVMNQGSSKMHPMLALLAVFGGVSTLGVVGLFLGPVLVQMAWTLFWSDT